MGEDLVLTDVWQQLSAYLSPELLKDVARALVILILGIVFAIGARRLFYRLAADRLSPQQAILGTRVIYYGILSFFGVMVLRQVGVDLSLLLGAAGVLTVALGFAAQTATSNLICGLFLIGERAFTVGDVIRIGDTTGVVQSIDLLSVKLRTFDNLLVRLPNEAVLKAEVTNLTHYPIRRVDLLIGVAYKEQVAEVEKLLLEVADRNPRCLDEPKPLFIFRGFGESSIDLQFSIWGTRENYLELKNEIQREIKEAFDAAGIEIPFPHRSLYAGSASEPLPVRLVADAARSEVEEEPPREEPPRDEPPREVPPREEPPGAAR